MDPKEIQRLVERRYLQCILDLTKTGKLLKTTVQMSARVMQAMRPWKDWNEALFKTEFFVSKFPEFADVFEYTKSIKREQDVASTIDTMHRHLKANDVESAIQVAQSSS